MSRRTFVVLGIVECLQPDPGGWDLIDSTPMVPAQVYVPLQQVEESAPNNGLNKLPWTSCLHAILRIISRGVSGLATDSPCGAWGRK